MNTENCSFIGVGGICCGENRRVKEIVTLGDCQEDIRNHLSSCHLSKAKIKECEVITARAGIFHPTEEQLRNMTICPSHRNGLGRFWRPLRSCQYPLHSGPVRKCPGKDAFNMALSEAAFTLYGKLVQIGSRKLFNCVLKQFYFLYELSSIGFSS